MITDTSVIIRDPATGRRWARQSGHDACNLCTFIADCSGDGDGTPAEGVGEGLHGVSRCGVHPGEVWVDLENTDKNTEQ